MKLNERKLKLFKTLYEKAVKAEKTEFKFMGHDFLVSYAKYVIEFNEMKL